MTGVVNCIQRAPPVTDVRPKKKRKIQEKQSKYRCVSWNVNSKKWHAKISHQKSVLSGRYWDDEREAAKAVNALCDLVNIPRKNPGAGVLVLPPLQRREKKKLVRREVNRNDGNITERQLEQIMLELSDTSEEEESDTSSSDGEYEYHLHIDPESKNTANGFPDKNVREATIQFESSEMSPWGVTISLDQDSQKWIVEAVEPEAQFFQKGVRTGWLLYKVDDEICFQNEEKHRKLLESAQECAITFTIPNGKVSKFRTTEQKQEYERLKEIVPFGLGEKVDAFWEGENYNDWFAAIVKGIDYESKVLRVQFVGETDIQTLKLDRIRKFDGDIGSQKKNNFKAGDIVEAFWEGAGYNSWYLAKIQQPCRRSDIGYILTFDGEKKMYVLDHTYIRKPVSAPSQPMVPSLPTIGDVNEDLMDADAKK